MGKVFAGVGDFLKNAGGGLLDLATLNLDANKKEK